MGRRIAALLHKLLVAVAARHADAPESGGDRVGRFDQEIHPVALRRLQDPLGLGDCEHGVHPEIVAHAAISGKGRF